MVLNRALKSIYLVFEQVGHKSGNVGYMYSLLSGNIPVFWCKKTQFKWDFLFYTTAKFEKFFVVYCYHVGVGVVVVVRRPNTFSFRTLTLVKVNGNL